MKKITILGFLIVFSFLLFSSCTWNKNVVIKGIKFEKMRYLFDGKDTIAIYGKLANEMIINNYPCAADWVKLSIDRNLLEFCLSKDFEISHVNLKKGTWIFMQTPENLICVFPNDHDYQGYLCRGGGGKKGIQTSFYSSGRLKSFFPKEDVIVDDIHCRATLMDNIELYEDGKLKHCKLAQDQKIHQIAYKKGSNLNFDSEGNVKNEITSPN